MIIPNGYIRIISATGGGFKDGKPVRATKTTSGLIAANIAESRRGHGPAGEQTQATSSAYSILVEAAEAPQLSERDRVEVLDSRKARLGVYDVQSARLLDFVDAVKIVV